MNKYIKKKLKEILDKCYGGRGDSVVVVILYWVVKECSDI